MTREPALPAAAIAPASDLTGRPYFERRPPGAELRFEENYWGNGLDPDGNRRNHFLERQRRLEDLEAELRFINSLPPGRILDVGCGLGHLLSGVAEAWDRHGVEVSQTAAKHAAQYGAIRDSDLRTANYPSSYFDVVVSYHVMEHMLDPVAELSEMTRVLRPGGHLIVGVPNFDSACARRFGDHYRMLHDPTHISLFSESSLRQMLLDEGLQVLHADFPYFGTRHFTPENLIRLSDSDQVSPPFWGNIMTFYTRKPRSEPLMLLRRAGRAAHRIAAEQGEALERLAHALQRASRDQAPLIVAPAAQQVFGGLRRTACLSSARPSRRLASAIRLGLGATDLALLAQERTALGGRGSLFNFLLESQDDAAAGELCRQAEGEIIRVPRPEASLLGPVARLVVEMVSPE